MIDRSITIQTPTGVTNLPLQIPPFTVDTGGLMQELGARQRITNGIVTYSWINKMTLNGEHTQCELSTAINGDFKWAAVIGPSLSSNLPRSVLPFIGGDMFKPAPEQPITFNINQLLYHLRPFFIQSFGVQDDILKFPIMILKAKTSNTGYPVLDISLRSLGRVPVKGREPRVLTLTGQIGPAIFTSPDVRVIGNDTGLYVRPVRHDVVNQEGGLAAANAAGGALIMMRLDNILTRVDKLYTIKSQLEAELYCQTKMNFD